jgi:large subunit ribosomal protein L3
MGPLPGLSVLLAVSAPWDSTRNRDRFQPAEVTLDLATSVREEIRSMRVGMLGRKVGMTQIYKENGTVIPVTVLECGPCTVMQVRTADRDGYSALQLGFVDKKRKSATSPERGHARKAETEPKRFVREIRQEGPVQVAPAALVSRQDPEGKPLPLPEGDSPVDVAQGMTLSVKLFQDITRVDVTGTSKGRGFAGVIKRHGFKGLRASHGVKRMHRHPGSSGPSADPSRTQKGIRKPGQYGNARVTVRNLEIVKIDAENNLLLVKGAVPGHNNAFVVIQQTNKL